MISNAKFNTIAALDLDPIKAKLMHKESGEGWALEKANAIEFEYRRFLYLMKMFPEEQTAPLFDVDIFWHYHILDTMKYAADCEHVFGYFLHHFPYIGMRGADDEVAHHRSGARMQELYEATFGERYIRPYHTLAETEKADASATTANTAFCSVTAKPSFCSVTAANTAFCSVTAKPSFCSVTAAKPSFCSVTAANTAFCSVAAKSAFCSVTAKPSFCSATAKSAFCSVAAKSAFCSMNGRSATNTASSGSDSVVASQMAGFYSDRPALDKAA